MSTKKIPKRRCKVIVSDFHLGSGRYFRDGTKNILEDFYHDDAFIAFLDHHTRGDFADAEVELIINGDFLNLLQINYKGVHTRLMTEKIVLEGLRKIVAGHHELFVALKRFAATEFHKIVYVIGNHDQGMLFDAAKRYFSEVVGTDVRFYEHEYEFDGVLVEHGHMHEWPSRVDAQRGFLSKGLPEPVLNLPWGSLFVAECLPKIKMERSYVDKVKPFGAMLRWIFLNDFWFAVKTFFRIAAFFLSTLFFSDRYRLATFKSTLNLLKELTIYPNFDREAEKILREKKDIHTVVMGHTHVMRYRQYREGKQYFNIGTWNEATSLQIANLGTLVCLSYGFAEYPELPEGVTLESTQDKNLLKPQIRLKEWRGPWRPEVDIT